jgi:hypothetical protein
MLRIPCPKCRRISYTSDVESFRSCAHCGFIFSGKYGPERREEERIKKEISFVLDCQGGNHPVSTIDISKSGLAIKILGKAPIEDNEILNFNIDAEKIMAKVVWVKKLPRQTLAGLAKLN